MIDCLIRLYLESDRSGLSAPAAPELMISQKDYTRNLTDLGTGRSRFQNGWFLNTILLRIWPICAPLRAGRRGACLTRLAPWDGKVVLVCFHTFSYRKTILSQIDPNGAIHIYIYIYSLLFILQAPARRRAPGGRPAAGNGRAPGGRAGARAPADIYKYIQIYKNTDFYKIVFSL